MHYDLSMLSNKCKVVYVKLKVILMRHDALRHKENAHLFLEQIHMSYFQE